MFKQIDSGSLLLCMFFLEVNRLNVLNLETVLQ